VLVLFPVVAAAWAWFGITGTFPVLICWWRRWPVACADPWLLDPARVRSARLGPWRTRIDMIGARPVEIFHDEIAPADLARLRRTLKAQLAAGRSTSSRSE
jgi:hypothetical protein